VEPFHTWRRLTPAFEADSRSGAEDAEDAEDADDSDTSLDA
jgi:hypothetical protein